MNKKKERIPVYVGMTREWIPVYKGMTSQKDSKEKCVANLDQQNSDLRIMMNDCRCMGNN